MHRSLHWIAALAAMLQLHCGGGSPGESGRDGPRNEWSGVLTTGSPTARHEASMAATRGKGYLMGGRGVKPVEEFDPATLSWRKLGDTPIEMHHFQPVSYGETIYVMTAMTGKYPTETPLETVYLYDPATDSWRQGPEIPRGRRRGGAGTAVHGGKIYLACGIVDGHTSGTVAWFDEFDPRTREWRQLPDAPRPRDHFSALVSGEKLYLVGGRNTSYHEPGNFTAFFGAVIPEIDVFDFASASWTTLPGKLPVPTAAGGLVEAGGAIYYFGGESAQDLAHSETQRLDVQTGEWTLVAPLQRGRHGAGAVALDGKIFVAAGSGGRGGGPELSSTEIFEP